MHRAWPLATISTRRYYSTYMIIELIILMYCLGTFSLIYCMSTLRTGVPKWGPRVPKWGQGYAFWAQNPHVLDLPQHTQKSGADQLRPPQIEREIERDHVRRFFRFSTDSLVIVSLKLSLFHSRLSMDPDVAQTCHCPACCASRRAHCSCLQSW